MDEAEHADRVAIMSAGQIVALDTPAALKAQIGADRVTITTADDDSAVDRLATAFGLTPQRKPGGIVLNVEDGEHFVPQLFARLDIPIRSVTVARPSLDDVFMAHTGSTILEAEQGNGRAAFGRIMAGRR